MRSQSRSVGGGWFEKEISDLSYDDLVNGE